MSNAKRKDGPFDGKYVCEMTLSECEAAILKELRAFDERRMPELAAKHWDVQRNKHQRLRSEGKF